MLHYVNELQSSVEQRMVDWSQTFLLITPLLVIIFNTKLPLVMRPCHLYILYAFQSTHTFTFAYGYKLNK